MSSSTKGLNSSKIIYLFAVALLFYVIVLNLLSDYLRNYIDTHIVSSIIRALLQRLYRGNLTELVLPLFLGISCAFLFKREKMWIRRCIVFLSATLLVLVSVRAIADITFQTIKIILKPSYLIMKRDVELLSSLSFGDSMVLTDPVTSMFMSYKGNDLKLVTFQSLSFHADTYRIFNPIFNDKLLYQDLKDYKVDYIILNTAILPEETMKKFNENERYLENIYIINKTKMSSMDIADNLVSLFKRKDFGTVKNVIQGKYKEILRGLFKRPIYVYKVKRDIISSYQNDKAKIPFDFKKDYLVPYFDYYQSDLDNMQAYGYHYLGSDVLKIDFQDRINIKRIEFDISQITPGSIKIEVFLDNRGKVVSKEGSRLIFSDNDFKRKEIFDFLQADNIKTIYLSVYGSVIDDRLDILRFTITTDKDKAISGEKRL